MAAHENLHPLQFHYIPPNEFSSAHQLGAYSGDTYVGGMDWDARRIRSILVEPEHQRQGVATALWNEGHRLASENARTPQPQHSDDRTNAGDAWARAVGGKLPRRRK